MRRLIVRISLIIGIIIIGVLLFVFGQQHKIFFDNKTYTFENVEYSQLDSITVEMNNEVEEVKKKKRKVLYVQGPFQKVTVKYLNENGEEQVLEKKFSIKLNSEVVINLPALINDVEGWIEINK